MLWSATYNLDTNTLFAFVTCVLDCDEGIAEAVRFARNKKVILKATQFHVRNLDLQASSIYCILISN